MIPREEMAIESLADKTLAATLYCHLLTDINRSPQRGKLTSYTML